MKHFFFIFFLTLFSKNLFCQNCNCSEIFANLSDIIESDYAGFTFKVKNSKINYSVLKKKIIKEISKKQDILNYDCGYILYQYLDQFRDEHISFAKKADSLEINTFTSGKLIFPFKKELTTKGELFEGIWYSKSLEIVVEIKKNISGFIGNIVHTKSKIFKQDQTKFYIVRSTNNKFIVITLENYFTGNRVKAYTTAKLKNDSLLLFKNFYSLRKLIGKANYDSLLTTKSASLSNKPELKIVNNSIVLKIPSFSYKYKKIIDSLCDQPSLFSKYRNLILDLRGNTGGTIECIYPLEKYLYTNAFRYIGGYRTATDSAIKFYEEYVVNIDSQDTVAKKDFTKLLNNMKKNKGGLVFDSGDLVKHDSVYYNPQKIGVIIDGYCASAVELVLLAIKNSKKVFLFGETTAGVVDTGEAFEYNIINCKNHYFLSVPNVVCDFVKYKSIDGVGIDPDFFVNTSSENCISEVINILNKHTL